MSDGDAVSQLESMVAANEVPVLDGMEVLQLLELARRADSTGRPPTDADWEPTYDLNAAAAEGWRRKAGKVAGAYSFSDEGSSFNRSDMVKACMDMARTYSGRVSGSIPLVLVDEWDTDIAGNVNV